MRADSISTELYELVAVVLDHVCGAALGSKCGGGGRARQNKEYFWITESNSGMRLALETTERILQSFIYYRVQVWSEVFIHSPWV